MDITEFKAIMLSNEIDLGKIARHFGINRKFKWEDSLVLQDKSLKGIVRDINGKFVYIFSFGSMVFVNCQDHEIMDIIQYLKQIEKSLNTADPFEYADDYRLGISEDVQPAINNDFMVTQHEYDYQWEIIATILAKSVALDRIESGIGVLLDEIEDLVDYLHQGKLTISDERLAKISARIFGFKFNTISSVMLLDKPDITWSNSDAGELFRELSLLFELEDRYEKIRRKTEILMDITEVFTGLVHAKRGARLEWAVIILICIEIALSLLDLFVLK